MSLNHRASAFLSASLGKVMTEAGAKQKFQTKCIPILIPNELSFMCKETLVVVYTHKIPTLTVPFSWHSSVRQTDSQLR